VTDDRTAALLDLLRLLDARGYRFVTPTPATHARVVARPDRARARSVEDVLGWSLPFAPATIDDAIERLLDQAGALIDRDGLRASTLRVSSLHDQLFLHSAYPTVEDDAVFFGPDSYRFADLIAGELGHGRCRQGARIVDIGAGAGVGALIAARACPDAQVVMTDINAKALDLARINAEFAGIAAELFDGEGLSGTQGAFDVVTANPPYIIDDGGPTYRAGGDMHGGQVSLDMATEGRGAARAPAGGCCSTPGSAILDGVDPLRRALRRPRPSHRLHPRLSRARPDVFGEELEKPAYADVDRIALVAAVLTRPD
jgi:methylase of polypeptide subunit release factors